MDDRPARGAALAQGQRVDVSRHGQSLQRNLRRTGRHVNRAQRPLLIGASGAQSPEGRSGTDGDGGFRTDDVFDEAVEKIGGGSQIADREIHGAGQRGMPDHSAGGQYDVRGVRQRGPAGKTIQSSIGFQAARLDDTARFDREGVIRRVAGVADLDLAAVDGPVIEAGVVGGGAAGAQRQRGVIDHHPFRAKVGVVRTCAGCQRAFVDE